MIDPIDIDSPVVVQSSVAKQKGVEWGGSLREVGLPDIVGLISSGISDEALLMAIKRQSVLAENSDLSIFDSTDESNNGKLSNKRNRAGSLHIFFYTDQGRNVLRSLLWCGRYSKAKIAEFINSTISQLNDYLNALGWSASLEEREREIRIKNFEDQARESLAKTKLDVSIAASKMVSGILRMEDKESVEFSENLQHVAKVIQMVSPERPIDKEEVKAKDKPLVLNATLTVTNADI